MNRAEGMSDEEVVTKVLEGAIALYEVLVGRYHYCPVKESRHPCSS